MSGEALLSPVAIVRQPAISGAANQGFVCWLNAGSKRLSAGKFLTALLGMYFGLATRCLETGA